MARETDHCFTCGIEIEDGVRYCDACTLQEAINEGFIPEFDEAN